jgi:hypothetical protein
MKQLLIILSLAITTTLSLQAQNNLTENLKVFVDCRTDCDLNFFRTKVPYIDYVRDQGLANVHVLINSISTAAGGRRYTLQFIDTKGSYSEAPTKEVIFDTPPNATSDDIRNKMVNRFALGLVPYIINTPAGDLLTLTSPTATQTEVQEKNSAQAEFDPWNYWVFEAGFDIDANFQAARTRTDLRADLDISRITDDWRIATFIYYRTTNQRFFKEEGDIISILSRYGVYNRAIKSINDHWSVGAFGSVSHSNFQNNDLDINGGPALEYSIFPYEEAIYKEFTIAYYTRLHYRDYIEETIYNKTSEFLWDQRLQMSLRLRKPWGSVRSSLSGRHFFQDFSKNSIEFNNDVNVRIFKGLAIRFSTNFEFINDQLSLPLGEVSLEDLLLAQRQLATNYDFSFSVGLNYTFGSIYNNVINTRL